jgi:hypothetical protein
LLLIINGVIRPDRLSLLLRSQKPRVKVVKLHGDLFQPFMAWTVEEMDTFLTEIAPSLKPAIADRDVLVVGHSLRDERIRDLAQTTGGALWFTHPVKVPDYLTGNSAIRVVVAPESAFEKFFPALAQALLLETPAAPATPRGRAKAVAPSPTPPVAPTRSASSIDDLLAAVVAIAGPDGAPSSTAFLLDQPRVIVCDAVHGLVEGRAELDLIASDGRRFRSRVLRTNRAHPFGPTLLTAPDELHAPGLRLKASPMDIGEILQVAVAGGEKTGVSTGATTTGIHVTIMIDPIGQVSDLAMMNAFVRPGSSGAPVVDQKMAVRGFIVAGSKDEANPYSLMYPARYWADFVAGRRGARPEEKKRKPVPKTTETRRKSKRR